MNNALVLAASLGIACAAAKPAGTSTSTPQTEAKAQVALPEAIALDGLGPHRRPVTGASPEAQRWFDQGLNVVYAFNHDEAIRAFTRAAALSPGCAMAWWGIAYANGPHINNPQLDPEHAQAAWAALQRAQAASAAASPVERGLIAALAKRYANPPPDDRAPLDAAYAEAMREVSATFPQDTDVAALFGRGADGRAPLGLLERRRHAQPWTEEILRDPRGGARERGAPPDGSTTSTSTPSKPPWTPRAAPAPPTCCATCSPVSGTWCTCPRTSTCAPGAGRMPSISNRRAIAADAAYRKKVPRQGFYAVYMAHNQHMLAYAAMMSGRSALALQAAKDLVAGIPAEFRAAHASAVDLYYAMPLEVLLRFGRWEEILVGSGFRPRSARGPRPPPRCPRGGAHCARRGPPGEGGAGALRAGAHESRSGRVVWEQPGLRCPRRGRADGGRRSALPRWQGRAGPGRAPQGRRAGGRARYDEPPELNNPVRHALGAALSQSGRFAEAESVFREDLRRTPANGWSLYGLSRALESLKDDAEAMRLHQQFQAVWKEADVQLKSAGFFRQQGV